MFDILAGERYKGAMKAIGTLFEYRIDTDQYIPKFVYVDGEAMRDLVDALTGYENALTGKTPLPQLHRLSED